MEVNFDSLVGPTHNYAGLSYGNVASMCSRHHTSNPRSAALQGLAKMKRLADRGILQALLPPHERPAIAALRTIGFEGDDLSILTNAARHPTLFANFCSASAMWAANAATVSPSADTADKRLHLTPANLLSNLHRSIETPFTTRILRFLFKDKQYFTVHDPLPSTLPLSDEGAANHGRICRSHQHPGTELFVWGRKALGRTPSLPSKFPARQTLEACQAIARRHFLVPDHTIFLQQNPVAIDAGCFHNDVVSVINESLLLTHEQAFCSLEPLEDLDLTIITVPSTQLSLEEAVSSYLFNSQLITKPEGEMLLVAPQECDEMESARRVIDQILEDQSNPISELLTFDLRESMRNGGGPACLRLRVAMTNTEIAAVNGRIFLDNELYTDLTSWVQRHYRDQLSPTDLADPQLLLESRAALDELTQIMELGSLYDFQRETL